MHSVESRQPAKFVCWMGVYPLGTLLTMKVRELLKRLEEDGWRQVRSRGSHRQLKHAAKQRTVTVAGKPSADVPPGTLNAILKQAELKQ